MFCVCGCGCGCVSAQKKGTMFVVCVRWTTYNGWHLTDHVWLFVVDFTGKKGLTLKEFLEVILLYNIYLLFFCLATSSWCIFGLYYYSVVTTSSSKRNNCCCGSAEESFDLSLLLLVYSSCWVVVGFIINFLWWFARRPDESHLWRDWKYVLEYYNSNSY